MAEFEDVEGLLLVIMFVDSCGAVGGAGNDEEGEEGDKVMLGLEVGVTEGEEETEGEAAEEETPPPPPPAAPTPSPAL